MIKESTSRQQKWWNSNDDKVEDKSMDVIVLPLIITGVLDSNISDHLEGESEESKVSNLTSS